jgi:alkanesulfonate monooxygenase SsuD/methylene tetrahydromethanopterin reductase-like flavin-dependent oxidoreductase (luciferase family)
MKLGICILAHDAGNGDVISSMARDAENAGLDSVWFFDSLGRGNMAIDPLIGVSVAAAITQRIEVGIGILEVPLRNPFDLTKSILTAQMACQGRLLLGVGSGSTKVDFEAVGKPFDQRLKLLEDGITTMRKLWNGESIDGISMNPIDQVKGGPPLFIGSWAGSKWIHRTAKEFDGWIGSAHFAGFNTLKQGIDRFRGAGGKRAIVTNISLDLTAPTEPLDGDGYNVMCAPAEAKRRLQHLAVLGFDDAVVVHRSDGPPDYAAIRALVS